MIVREATGEDIWHVCHHLRAADRVEQFATRFDEDPDALARDMTALTPLAIKRYALCTSDSAPACLVAAFIKSPGVAMFNMVSTDRAGEIMRRIHRWGKRRFIPLVLEPNVHRAECRILSGRPEILRWVACFGFALEGIARGAGKNGEDFAHVAWTRKA